MKITTPQRARLWLIVSLLIFAGVAPCSAGTDSDTGLEPGYWETHSVLYAEVQSWTPDGGRDRSGTLVLRAYATLTGDWDCGAEPIVSALCITGHGTTVREFNLVPGARVFVALTHADDDLLVSGAAMFYMPLSACLIPVAESASRECWDYMWARLTRVRAGLPPPSPEELPVPPEFRLGAVEQMALARRLAEAAADVPRSDEEIMWGVRLERENEADGDEVDEKSSN